MFDITNIVVYEECLYRKNLNAGKLGEPRLGMFISLLEIEEKYKRVNQWG